MASIDKLTDRALRAALKTAEATGKVCTLADGAGLSVETQPSGVGWWRLRYRYSGKEQLLSLGTYPDVSLAQARKRRDEARAQLADGKNPSFERKAAKAAAAAKAQAAAIVASGGALPGSFEAVARDWIATVHTAKVSPGHAERTRIRFEQDAFPWIGARPIAELEAPELLATLRRVTGRGAIETAHRLKDACGQVFRYGIATGACVRNPAADLRDALPPVPTRHLAAIVDPKQAGELLRDMVAYQGHQVTRAALRLSALLLLRPGELRQMEWSWLDFDGTTLTIPANVMKRKLTHKANGVPHIVPLATQAVAILKEIEPLTGGEGRRFVFPSLLTGERCMSENTVRGALRRLGYDNDTMTAHGFRAMARTMLAERLGFAPEVIEAQLAHAVPDALGRAYNRTTFADQRRDMMDRWADYLDHLARGAKVMSLKAA